MNHGEVQNAIEELSRSAKQRYVRLRTLIILTWVYFLLAATVMAVAFMEVTASNKELAETINKRNPVIEYFTCVDQLDRARDAAQTEFVVRWYDLPDEPTQEEEELADRARHKYDQAEANLQNLKGC